ncbi:MAG: polysaccharide pyruvyl transferase CsaB [Clostridia bacterium]|nr:polysaccharide pyruvyl transferase CsaB [Clostridia bacterium]
MDVNRCTDTERLYGIGVGLGMRVLVSGYHGMGNLGDEAVLAAFLQHLAEIDPHAECTVLSGDPDSTRKAFGVSAVPRTSLPAIIREIRRADILVSGGGSLLQDVTGALSVPYYLGIITLARLSGRPASVYAQGIGPLNSGFSRLLVRQVMSWASVITLRDQGSCDLLRRLGHVRPEPALVTDPAFALRPAQGCSLPAEWTESREASGRPVVVFCFRPWPSVDGREAELAACVDRISSELGVCPVFLAFQPGVDLPLARRIAGLMKVSSGPPAVIGCGIPPQQVLAMIAQAELVVGMRLHSLVFAAAAGVPFVAIDYDPKVRAVSERVGNPNVAPANASGDELFRVVSLAWADRARIRQLLSEIRPELEREGRQGAELALAPVMGKARESRVEKDGRKDARQGDADARRAVLLGVPVDCVDMDEAVARCMRLAESGEGGHVVTLNPEMTLASGRDEALMEAIRGADLVAPDGIGVVLGLKLTGSKPRGRVAGIELATRLMQAGALGVSGPDADARVGLRFFFVGAKPGVAEQAAEKMREANPGLSIVGTHHGYFQDSSEDTVLHMISAAHPDVVFVAMGAGKQEKWIAKARHAAPAAVWIGVGGSLDVLSGNTKRAPVVFRKLGLEWLYRLVTEPSRAKRMTALPVFMLAAIGEAFRKGRRD